MIVIADDLTGAAEIAGIAFEHGLCTHLAICTDGESILSDICNGSSCITPSSVDVLVIATDTRSMTAHEASLQTLRLSSQLVSPSFGGGQGEAPFGRGQGEAILFKKTDSALRGHVVEELTAVMQTAGYERAVFLPANPSKGRVIRGGNYFVNGVPIHQTDFSFDPEFPAITSSMAERFPDAAAHHILMPDAVSADDMARVVHDYSDGHTLFAGAADLFTALLTSLFPQHPTLNRQKAASRRCVGEHSTFLGQGPQPLVSIQTPTLFLCGSTQSTPPQIGLPVVNMPLSVYEGDEGPESWLQRAKEPYTQNHGAILTISHRHLTGRTVAVRTREAMAFVARELVRLLPPRQLIIEGGATAFACLQALGWSQLSVAGVLAPGVVALATPDGTTVVLKPGSYAWTHTTDTPQN